MSIFSIIDKDVKSVAAKIEVAYKALFADEPKIEAIAVQVIATVAPEVVAIAAVVGGAPEAAATTGIISAIKTGLAAAQVAFNQAGQNQTAKGFLQAVVANLQSILTVSGIKDATTVATLTKDIDGVVEGLQVVIAAL